MTVCLYLSSYRLEIGRGAGASRIACNVIRNTPTGDGKTTQRRTNTFMQTNYYTTSSRRNRLTRSILAVFTAGCLVPGHLLAGIVPNGVNVQPSYYNNGNVNFGWSLMNANSAIGTVRIEIEPTVSISQVQSWISQARANGKTVIATYHKASVLGSDSTTELNAAATWWRNNYATLNGSGSFTVNLMNEWGSHNISASSFASAYNSAISTVRGVYSGRIIVDIPGWGQETHTAAQAIVGSGTKITDANIALSVHIYPGDWNQALNHWLQNSDLDELNSAGRACIAGEFGTGSGSADWSGLVDHASALGWSVLAWAWNGDGGSLNMVTPTWASNPTATSFSTSSYFNTVYPKLGGGGGGCTPTTITPYVQVNGGAWQQTATASVSVGGTVAFGPQPTSGGSWRWSGPNGFSATTREVTLNNLQTSQGGTYTATYTNPGGCNSTQNFTLTVSGGGGGDTAIYNFEADTQGWAGVWGNVTGVARSSTQKFAGTYSLQVTINKTTSTADGHAVAVANPANAQGRTVTFHVWVPSNTPIQALQPFAQTGSGWTWTGNWVTSVTKGGWTTVTVNVPNTTPVQQIGVEFDLTGPFSGNCYVDSVTY